MGFNYNKYRADKAIALFDGWVYNKEFNEWLRPHTGGIAGKVYDRKVKKLQYHSNWNWIMKVVDTIRQMKSDPNECFMGTTLERAIAFSRVVDMPISSPIETVCKEVYTFINWYNDKLKNRKS